ncbi:ELKS/Rab6-interacting/CAST family protein [Candidatus Binatia bacterium]|nr:ELKS/Rab6-interacting/CAST family protein [Candidatus Binatia bacterium]
MRDEGRAVRMQAPESPFVDPAEALPPTLGDLLRYLWGRRVRLLVLFGLLSGLGGAALLAWWILGTRSAHGVIALGFRGIERHEYPSGRAFTVEDIRSPKVLTRALDDVGVAPAEVDLQAMYRGIDLVPIVPASVIERWKKQDREGAKREEFLPNEFALGVSADELDEGQRVRLLYAIVKAYQEQVKYEQQAEQQRVSPNDVPPARLAVLYDYWDIPLLLRARADDISSRLQVLIRESQNFRDSEANLSFLEVDRELDLWRETRLETLAAVVHRERLVKDPEAMRRRLEEREANLEIDLRKTNAEVESMAKLLEVVGQPQPVLAGQAARREGTPLLDTDALQTILRSDYIGPVVQRAMHLQQVAAATAAAKERVQHELVLLTKGDAPVTGTPPAAFEELVVQVAGDLDRIVQRYVKVLDAYLDASLARVVTLRDGPYLRLGNVSMTVIAVAILFAAALASLLVVIVGDSLRAGRGPSATR